MTKRPFLLGFCVAVGSDVYHYATPVGRGLSSGTSPERIAPESVTPLLSGFVHRNISRGLRSAALDQVRQFGGEFLKVFDVVESNQKWGRVKR
jgi:hypothetical protein